VKIQLRAPIVLRFHSPIVREVYFVITAVRGGVISGFVFVAYVFPLTYLQWLRGLLVAAAMVLALPILVVSKLVPPIASPILEQSGEIAGNLGSVFWAHMLPGVLAYVLIFHIPVFIRLLRRGQKQDAGVHA